MKLLVIIICLISERYLVHSLSNTRFQWFGQYFSMIKMKLPQSGLFSSSWFVLLSVILPLMLISALAFYLLGGLLFGFVGFILDLVVFYYCIGPENSFYPVSTSHEGQSDEPDASTWFAQVNHQLFAVIFWFVLTGPLGIILYRLLYLCKDQESTCSAADLVISWLDWVTARITLLLYMLVGNFQRGWQFYTSMFFSSPEKNETLLREGGLLVAKTNEEDVLTLSCAQHLVEHALIVFLVFLAVITIMAVF